MPRLKEKYKAEIAPALAQRSSRFVLVSMAAGTSIQRVRELAGGDYIPIGSPDFRGFEPVIRDEAGYDAGIPYTRSYDSLTFTMTDETGTYLLPVTWYKGWQVYKDNEPVPTEAGLYRLVSFETAGPGTYTCRYTGTLIQKTSLALSLFSAAALILLKRHRPAAV